MRQVVFVSRILQRLNDIFSADKVATCMSLGADGGSNRHDGPWLDAVRDWAGKGGVDVILDPVAASYLAQNQAALAVGGRIVVIGLLGGRTAELDLGRLLVKRQRVVGSVLRARSKAEKDEILTRVRAAAWPLCVEGTVVPQIDCVMPLPDAGSAHAHVASNATIGKVVLQSP